LRRFGLGIGDRDDEALGAHRRQHERGGDHLRRRAESRPAEVDRGQPRQVEAGPDKDACEKHQRERQAEQEAHLCGGHRAERAHQIALHRIAQRLRRLTPEA